MIRKRLVAGPPRSGKKRTSLPSLIRVHVDSTSPARKEMGTHTKEGRMWKALWMLEPLAIGAHLTVLPPSPEAQRTWPSLHCPGRGIPARPLFPFRSPSAGRPRAHDLSPRCLGPPEARCPSTPTARAFPSAAILKTVGTGLDPLRRPSRPVRPVAQARGPSAGRVFPNSRILGRAFSTRLSRSRARARYASRVPPNGSGMSYASPARPASR